MTQEKATVVESTERDTVLVVTPLDSEVIPVNELSCYLTTLLATLKGSDEDFHISVHGKPTEGTTIEITGFSDRFWSQPNVNLTFHDVIFDAGSEVSNSKAVYFSGFSELTLDNVKSINCFLMFDQIEELYLRGTEVTIEEHMRENTDSIGIRIANVEMLYIGEDTAKFLADSPYLINLINVDQVISTYVTRSPIFTDVKRKIARFHNKLGSIHELKKLVEEKYKANEVFLKEATLKSQDLEYALDVLIEAQYEITEKEAK